ncbi:DUF3048 domain-containing protein [Nocardioides jiangxiensis]|uniref:DUF3048 domain-containing protein n=1 Tax=Nocardioides jiangxiensis TaxID=3064524 RepID=A0ABT9B298_9ACTN|nr:DUF3048 domain-containing protein [Nocardioides sp. WY-20]MDO7868976.1 DUF3048 domain-containing protein [Nocardioides sp. WY-20]
MRLSVAATLAASVVLAGCGGSTGNGDTGSSDKPSSSAPAAQPETWPLTGLRVPDGRSPESPAYIVKIDNTGASAPQYGLGKADMVVEELVEGGITRLAAFFQSQLPTKVGPVRSMRLTDIGVAKPLGAEIVTSGAAVPTLNGLREAGVKFADMSNPAVVRDYDGSHDYLHSVVANLQKLAAQQKHPARPVDYLPFGDAKGMAGGKPATAIDARMSAARTAHWQLMGHKYVLQNGYMPDGDVFKADTVITCMVRTSLAPYLDPAGNPVPVSHFEGKGQAIIFHDGKAVRVTWKKPKVGDTVTFVTKSGAQFKVPAGRTWLHLVPSSGGSVSFR